MHRNRGFTLVELMVTLAILAIMLAIAAPSFHDAIRNNRTQATANDLLTALQYARSEAIKRGEKIDVCRRNGNSCANATNWSAGWLVKISGASGEVLRVWQALDGQSRVTGPNETMTYRPNGLLLKSLNAPDIQFVIDTPNCSGKPLYRISLSATGRATSIKGTCP